MWVDDLFIRKYADQEPTFTISAEHLLTKTGQTPTEPSETHGFGALFALMGLITAIYFVRRLKR